MEPLAHFKKNAKFNNVVLKKMNNLLFNLRSLTVTDIKLIDGLIHCSYSLALATRIHNIPITGQYQLPKIIINSFAFKYFPEIEKDFILACKAFNDTLRFAKEYPHHQFIKLSMGKEIIIMIYNSSNKNNFREFKINDLSKFTGLCRRYKTPTEVEKIMITLFKRCINA